MLSRCSRRRFSIREIGHIAQCLESRPNPEIAINGQSITGGGFGDFLPGAPIFDSFGDPSEANSPASWALDAGENKIAINGRSRFANTGQSPVSRRARRPARTLVSTTTLPHISVERRSHGLRKTALKKQVFLQNMA